MTESLHEQIHREMAAAFDGENQRAMSDEAREALGRFIDKAVVRGIGGDTGLYARYREYLTCRLRHVAAGINARVAPGETVTWEDIRVVATGEVGFPRAECALLIVPADPESSSAEAIPEARICLGFVPGELGQPETATP